MKQFLFLLMAFSLNGLWAQDSLNMQVLFHWDDTTMRRSPAIGNQYSDVWGWHDPANNREYAIIGSTIGTHFFDLTDPNDIQLVDFVPGRSQNVVHRDLKSKGSYLYAVSDEFEGSLQIMDMSSLPDSVSVVYDDDEFFQQSHNLLIDGDRMYACIPRQAWAAPSNFPGLAVYDISTPDAPSLLATYPDSVYGWGNIHDLYVRNDTGYLNAEQRGMYVVDFTLPNQPQVLAHLASYPFQGYNHSGWLTDDGKTYIMADETHGSPMKLMDVSDLSDLKITKFLFPGMTFPIQDTLAIAHNPIFRDNFLFASYYYDGVYVWDVSRRDSPFVAGFYDTYPGENDVFYRGAWGVYPFLPSGRILASDTETGLYVLDFNPPGGNTGLEEEWDAGIVVYPNPVSEQLRVRSAFWLTSPQLTLMDLSGRVVARQAYDGRQKQVEMVLDIPLSQGLYVLQIRSEEGSWSRKVESRK